MESAVLRESKDALRDLVRAFENVGLRPIQVAMMLRDVADEIFKEQPN